MTDTKIIISGDIIEVFCFQNPLFYNFKVKGVREKLHVDDIGEEQLKLRRQDSRKRSMQRAKPRFTRLVYANAGQWEQSSHIPFPPVFITFTFAENLTDPAQANKILSLFKKRLDFQLMKSRKSMLKYIAVTEFQGRGAVHFHCLFFNLPIGLAEEERGTRRIAEIWGHGFIDVKDASDVDGMVRYLTKYMVKGFEDPRLDGKKRYFGSRGLIKPVVVKHEALAQKIYQKLKDNEKIYERVFESDYHGITMYQKFKVSKDHNVILNLLFIKSTIADTP